MPGKLYNGTTKVATIRESRAFCEGRKASNDSELITANPYTSGTEEADAWDAGWTEADGAVAKKCCAE